MKVLWLDNLRDPYKYMSRILNEIDLVKIDNLYWATSFDVFKQCIIRHGLPNYIFFDHDLGLTENGEVAPSGYDCAKWLVNYCLEQGIPTPSYFIQSMNPVGKENIQSLIDNYNNLYAR